MISWTGDISVNICTPTFIFYPFFPSQRTISPIINEVELNSYQNLGTLMDFEAKSLTRSDVFFLCEVVWNLSVMAQGSNVEQKTISSIYWWLYQNKYGIHCSSYNDSSGMLLDKPRISLAPNEALEDGCDYEAAHDFSTSSEWHAELWGNDIESKHTFYWKISNL